MTITVEVYEPSMTVEVNEVVYTVTLGLGSITSLTPTITTSNPVAAPATAGTFWYNSTTGQLFFAKGTSTVNDWKEVPIMP